MKKSILLIVICLITLAINAQDKQIEFGIKGGLNYSSFIDNNNDDIPADYKGTIGFHIGGFIQFEMSEKILLRPELLYSQQGSNFTINGSDLNLYSQDDIFVTSIDGKIKESLLLLPINLGYKLNESLRLEFGPQFGYSLNREVEFEDNPFDGEFIRNDEEEKFELGFGLGLGYALSDDLGLSLRYNYGIIERQNLNTSVIQLGAYYKL